MIEFIVGLVLGFAAGLLVYRHNAKGFKADEAAAKAKLVEAVAKLKSHGIDF